jgi:hypothetical protein
MPGDRFGYAVALDGQNLVVGARYDDDRAEDSGSAYLFVNSGTEWIQFSKLVAGDGRRHDEFGRAVAVSGDWAVGGAPNNDDGGIDAGAAYVFKRNPAIQLVTDLLLRIDQHTEYDPTPHPDGADGGVVSVEVAVQNSSNQILSTPSVQVLHHRRGYRVFTDDGPAVTGSFVAVDFGDASPTLEPGERFTITFDIGIPIVQPFNFAVNVYAAATDAPPPEPGSEPPPTDTTGGNSGPIVVEIPGEVFGIVPRLYLFMIAQ